MASDGGVTGAPSAVFQCDSHPVISRVFGGSDPSALVSAIFANYANHIPGLELPEGDSMFEMDHVCWRCADIEEYLRIRQQLLVDSLNGDGDGADMLLESMIGGRPIATFQLKEPLVFRRTRDRVLSSGDSRTTNNMVMKCSVIELPSPKRGSPYPSGWEHAEFAVGEGRFEEFVAKYVGGGNGEENPVDGADPEKPHPLNWCTDALKKKVNADISLSFTFSRTKEKDLSTVHGSVKFHELPLAEVIRREIMHGDVIPIPEDYFSGKSD
ncbi:unnamed protein product [Amoebophrya sp. A25]|nr:unnamed protein product [Amoebophrya sp. A25]|eukprot:GSA25T00005493001.1